MQHPEERIKITLNLQYALAERKAFDQVSEFDRGRIVAYRDCELPFRNISSCVGRNQTTEMRICDRWMQEGTTDRRGRSHPPQCTTSREALSVLIWLFLSLKLPEEALRNKKQSINRYFTVLLLLDSSILVSSTDINERAKKFPDGIEVS
ncbi:transposable element Tcb1 transposase [Trichonephila clavipes]|nr:transposable element Tcb1 transposase [Trichonephila clavipes]